MPLYPAPTLPSRGTVDLTLGVVINDEQVTHQLSYRSSVTGQDELVKLEFSIREPILEPGIVACPHAPVRSSGGPPPFLPSRCRCCPTAKPTPKSPALTRREPAIRDFYDIDYGVRSGGLDTTDPRMIELVAKKLAVPGNDPIDVSQRKRDALGRQTQGQLRPVLREPDFSAFDLARAFAIVADIASDFR